MWLLSKTVIWRSEEFPFALQPCQAIGLKGSSPLPGIARGVAASSSQARAC
jgi:hypothetical protein